MVDVKQQVWEEVKYSKNKIIKSGKVIRKAESTEEEIQEAKEVIDNWRAAHAYPLNIIYMYHKRMGDNVKKDIIVAQRLKRLDSIINKLKREPTMSLWTIQDLGGCRFIVPTIEDVYEYSERYRKSNIKHIFKKSYDYIAEPKKSGYRSLHMVYQYHSDSFEQYNNNMLIEVQYRTHLQHLWATAVETVDLFKNQAIKAGQGSEEYKRFFVLTSSLFALREGQPVVPGTSSNIEELVAEIKELDERCRMLGTLSGIRVAVDHELHNGLKEQGYYILKLNYNIRRLKIQHFKPSENDEANEEYTRIESDFSKSNIDAVLVRVTSFSTLKEAYPNYFADIGEFIEIVSSYLKE